MKQRQEIQEHVSALVEIALTSNNIRLGRGLVQLDEGLFGLIFGDAENKHGGHRLLISCEDRDRIEEKVKTAYITYAQSAYKKIVRDSRRGVDTSKRLREFKDELENRDLGYSDIGVSEEEFMRLERQVTVSTIRRSIRTVKTAMRAGNIGGLQRRSLEVLVDYINMRVGVHPEIGMGHQELHQFCVDAFTAIAKNHLAKLREQRARHRDDAVRCIYTSLERAGIGPTSIGTTRVELETLRWKKEQLKYPKLEATKILEDMRDKSSKAWSWWWGSIDDKRRSLESLASCTGLSLNALGTSEQELDTLVRNQAQQAALETVRSYHKHAPRPLEGFQKESIQRALQIGVTAKQLGLSESRLQHIMSE